MEKKLYKSANDKVLAARIRRIRSHEGFYSVDTEGCISGCYLDRDRNFLYR
ncbi:MAG TPA: hypothetical protein VM577_19575 [Anaerovoracaceae bacterium]|nr:hypothetical protein [Anaerovoracaceae bacterium]